ncbi:MAG: MlaD family protein [Bacteroidota bacterium]|nr:MlaD family protein [Bacteroidota bacterium]
MKLQREIKVAIFVIFAGTMLYSGFNFLKGIDFFSSTKSFFAEYKNVSGLRVSNAVYVNGLAVGRVSEIQILSDRDHTLKVKFDIDKKIVVGDSARAIISNQGLLGDKSIVMYLGNSEKPLPEGTTVISEVEKNFTEKLSEKAAPVVAELETTVKRINMMLSENNLKGLSNIIKNLDNTSSDVQKLIQSNSANIYGTTKNVEAITRSLIETEKQIKVLLSKLQTTTDSINKMRMVATIDNVNKSVLELNKVLGSINNGEGTVGKLIKDDSLYNALNHTATDLDKLIVDLKEHPERYVQFSVFGKKVKVK